MGRKRGAGNERLGEHVQRRSGGGLEIRFPLPKDVQLAFGGGGGKRRSHIIKSLGTPDVRLANQKADAFRTQVRLEIHRVREAHSSTTLGDFLLSLYDSEMAIFQSNVASDEPKRRAAMFDGVRATRPPPGTTLGERLAQFDASKRPRNKDNEQFKRECWGAALTSADPEERYAAAGWAADDYFLSVLHREPDRDAPEYYEVMDRCAAVLVDSIIGQSDIDAGRPLSAPIDAALKVEPPQSVDGNVATSERGNMRLSDYFEQIYVPTTQQAKGAGGERTVPGKRLAVKFFGQIIGDKRVFAITKADLWEFHDRLLEMPDRRTLKASELEMPVALLIEKHKAGELSGHLLSPKTVNRHLSGIKSILDLAEKRRDIRLSVAGGVRADVDDEEDTGRAFTTGELVRIFALPLFSGCMEGVEDGGIFKAGSVKIRDDRFWIPLLLLFSGARSSEIAGLSVDDVLPEHEIPHFLIRPNAIRGLKNKHSRRMVPVHPYLTNMGFLEFARARVSSGEAQFFSLVKQLNYKDGATGNLTKKPLSNSLIMRQFNRTMLDHANATENRGSIKCFRNTFEQESLAKIESDEMRRRLTGRDVQSTSKIYTQNIPDDPIKRTEQLLALDGNMRKIGYRGVDLSHLFVGPGPDTDGVDAA